MPASSQALIAARLEVAAEAKYRFRSQKATLTRPISAGTSTSGPITPTKASPEPPIFRGVTSPLDRIVNWRMFHEARLERSLPWQISVTIKSISVTAQIRLPFPRQPDLELAFGEGKPILTTRALGYACFNISTHRFANASSEALKYVTCATSGILSVGGRCFPMAYEHDRDRAAHVECSRRWSR
ncbi:MAG TPA: hypothetical protein VK638_36315, partial [Edaphobacter sp.]|nr:hypothetical protein [Edaphobacter sp.]